MEELLTIEQFNEELTKMKGKKIQIIKKELEDTDEIIIQIEDLVYHKNEKRLDDYTPEYVLQLMGEGSIKTEENNFVPLPDEDYEIPLNDEAHYQIKGGQFLIKTERAFYQMEPLH